MVEFDMEGNVLNANHIFLFLVGYSLEEIKGKHHSQLVGEEECNSDGYKKLWKALGEGEYISGEFLCKPSNGYGVWMYGSCNPFPDMDGQPRKVVKFARDITDQKLLDA